VQTYLHHTACKKYSGLPYLSHSPLGLTDHTCNTTPAVHAKPASDMPHMHHSTPALRQHVACCARSDLDATLLFIVCIASTVGSWQRPHPKALQIQIQALQGTSSPYGNKLLSSLTNHPHRSAQTAHPTPSKHDQVHSQIGQHVPGLMPKHAQGRPASPCR
jgi:hypothetical protein